MFGLPVKKGSDDCIKDYVLIDTISANNDDLDTILHCIKLSLKKAGIELKTKITEIDDDFSAFKIEIYKEKK